MLASTLVAPVALTVGAAGAAAAPAPAQPAAAQVAAEPTESFDALVFSKTAGFRHSSIPTGVAAIEALGAEHGFEVTATEDAGAFTTGNLEQYDVVVFLSTTGDVLNAEQQAAFEAFIQGGGGYAGIHAASDTEYDWPWYGDLVGAYFDNHPAIQQADIAVADHVHPSTEHLPTTWTRTDEWYSFQDNPRGDVHVLASLDETSYDGGTMGADHPIAWCQTYDGGRSWYTGGGHTEESFSEPEFLEHVLGGLQTAAGVVDADCSATTDSSFEQVTLAKGAENTGEPIAMAVLPDGDVLHTSRDGRVFLTTSDAQTSLAGQLDVYNHDEDGLQGIAIDPNFAENRWVYLYYAPPLDTPAGEAPNEGTAEDFAAFEGYNQLSRFQLSEDGTLDVTSEQKILEVAADRGICCHAGGEIDFDADGNLLLSTGDDTNPFASDGYTPIDEREGRNPAYDAQRSSANTNDLRGKLLRITVQEDGSYTIPEGNLFEPGTEKTRPEIYAMGFRNPFRFAVDRETGWIYLGDYGPDAGSADPERGPGGQVEFNLIKEPGNYGWPYCTGDNDAYVDHDFATGTSGETFDCDNPVNTSPHNTGLTELPPAIPAWQPYDGGSVPDFGTGGESPMGGPTYRFDPELDSETKWPEYYDGKNFSYEWDRGWIKEFLVDDEGALVDVVPALDWMDLRRPMNVEFGPDGAMYVLDYGGGYFGGDALSAVYRIDYVAGTRRPVAELTTSTTNGSAPLTVDFDASGSTDPEGLTLSYAWDFDGDGETDATGVTASHTYTENGTFTARLTVTAGEGEDVRTGTATTTITVGNTAPVVTLELPRNGGIFGFGDQIPFTVTVTDPEDGEIDCERVTVEYVLGHDNHGHPLARETGCEGVLTTAADDGHGLDADVFGVVNASYTDLGGDGVPALSGDDEAKLRLRHQQAEFYDAAEGVNVMTKDGSHGGKQVGDIHDGDWIAFEPMDLTGIDGVSYRYSSAGIGGNVEVRKGAVDGELLATTEVTPTGGWETWDTTAVSPLTPAGGDGPVYLVFTGDGTDAVFDIDEIQFHGKGVADNTAPTVSATATPRDGAVPLEISFEAEGTDADGDELTYAWDFGDGSTGEGAAVTHTYAEPGTYTAEVTVRDPQGATGTATVTVDAFLSATCENPDAAVEADDEFDGTEVDGCRWDVVNYDTDLLTVADGALNLTVTDDDFYGTPNTQVPNILRHRTVTGDSWTVETKFTGSLEHTYQQGGLVVYGDADNYVKMDPVFGTDGSATPLRIELRSEIDGVVQNPQPGIADLPLSEDGTYYVRLSRDGDTFTGSFSTDGESWTDMPEAVTNDRLDGVGVGVFALGRYQVEPTTLSFDYFRVVEDGTPEPPVCEPGEVEEGYRALFDGTQESLDAWNMAGPGSFELTQDCTMLTVGGMGLLWFPEEFGDYSLKLDWKMHGDDNSGVFVGFPDPGDDPWVAVNQGYEIQIDATDAHDRTTGAIYTFQGADAEARDEALKEPGEWNSYEIVVEGQNIKVFLNGTLINDFTSTDPARDLSSGLIGLQNHGNGDDVEFRDVRIADLEDEDPGPAPAPTFDEVLELVDRLHKDGDVHVSVHRQVTNHVTKAGEFFEDGRTDKASMKLGLALRAAEKVEDDDARTQLVDSLQALRTDVEGGGS